jgi:hypothetical protein
MSMPGSRGSFVARIWLEEEPEGQPTWRGHIRYVQGEQEAYFKNLREMAEFLERISGIPLPLPDAVADGRQLKKGH